MLQADTFNKYSVRISVETAQTLLELVRELDYSIMTREQVMALNGLQLNLEAIKEESEK
jgi:hypothetical protein